MFPIFQWRSSKRSQLSNVCHFNWQVAKYAMTLSSKMGIRTYHWVNWAQPATSSSELNCDLVLFIAGVVSDIPPPPLPLLARPTHATLPLMDWIKIMEFIPPLPPPLPQLQGCCHFHVLIICQQSWLGFFCLFTVTQCKTRDFQSLWRNADTNLFRNVAFTIICI